VVLAPAEYYVARGKKGASVAPTVRLLERMLHEHGVRCVLAAWNGVIRSVAPI
jgi:hypothetical protein